MLKHDFKPFSPDPGLNEAWWWFGVPFFSACMIFAIYRVAPDWYMAHMHPEGYGILELAHVALPLLALIVLLALLPRAEVRGRPMLFWWTVLLALGSLYIAGEEHSWGQHFFNWNTPAYWKSLNAQQETNLHNINNLFDDYPRAVLTFGIIIGGLIIPLLRRSKPDLIPAQYAIFMPANALMPTAVMVLLSEILDLLSDWTGMIFVPRESEVSETFYYMFILFYAVTYSRRVRQVAEAEQGIDTPQGLTPSH